MLFEHVFITKANVKDVARMVKRKNKKKKKFSFCHKVEL